MFTALLFSVVTAASPSPASDGWLAWQGCWRALGDDDPTSLLCIVPDGAGARLVTVVNGTMRGEMRLVSDGTAHPFELEGCKGTQKAVWSADQQRLFVTSDMTCGEATRRSVNGIMTMQSRTSWINVEAVTSGAQVSTRAVRYVAVDSEDVPAAIAAPLRENKLAREAARFSATARIDLGDVEEAVTRVNDAVVTTWLTELNYPFDLNGAKLVALADAGVSPAVIDVLVAVSNPQYFAMAPLADRTDRDDDDHFDRRSGRTRGISSCYDPFYEPWGASYNYGYNQCYRYGGHFASYGSGWNYGYGSPPVIVIRNPERNPNARVTRNGYTRGSDAGSAAQSPTNTSSGTGSTGGTGTTSSGSNDAGSSGGSSGSGRTAKPRDN